MQVSNSRSELDAEGQQFLDVQRHAAAVQLYSRSLAIAHLRAQLAMPRGSVLNVQRAPKPIIKPESDYFPDQQQRRRQQQPRMGHAAPPTHTAPAIQVSVTSTAADLQLQPPGQQQQQQRHACKHVTLKPRLLVRRVPDAAAAQRFKADELPDGVDQQAGVSYGHSDAAAGKQAALAPRIVADPSQLGHQLAGWSRVAGEGADAEEGGEGAAIVDDEDMLGPGAEIEEDNMDEEEWV